MESSSKLLQFVLVALVVFVLYLVVTDSRGPNGPDVEALRAKAAWALDEAERGGNDDRRPIPGPDDGVTRTCPQCNGRGEYSPDHSGNFFVPCRRCNGTGKITGSSGPDLIPGVVGMDAAAAESKPERDYELNPDCTCPDCDCGPDCQCSETECTCSAHLVIIVKDGDPVSQAQLKDLEQYNKDREAKGQTPVDVRPLDVQYDDQQVAELWAGRPLSTSGSDSGVDELGIPTRYPCYLRVQGGRVTHRWGPLPDGQHPDWEKLISPVAESKPKAELAA